MCGVNFAFAVETKKMVMRGHDVQNRGGACEGCCLSKTMRQGALDCWRGKAHLRATIVFSNSMYQVNQ